MQYRSLRYDVRDRVATITLDRPETNNMFSADVGDEIWHAFVRADGDAEVRVIVLTSTGTVFCGGVDLDIARSRAEQRRIAQSEFFRRFPTAVHDSPKPSICAITGHALGVGVTMALSFDLRIVAADARLTMPFARIGLIAGFGGSWFLPRLVGRAKALELLYTGCDLSGTEAAAIGLANSAVPADEVVRVAHELAVSIAAVEPVVLAYTKRAVDENADLALADGLGRELELFDELQALRKAAQPLK